MSQCVRSEPKSRTAAELARGHHAHSIAGALGQAAADAANSKPKRLTHKELTAPIRWPNEPVVGPRRQIFGRAARRAATNVALVL